MKSLKDVEKIDLLVRNLQEVIGQDLLNGCLEKNGTLNVYWGVAPTGRPHIAYFLPMTKLADFLNAGARVTILFADLHAYLDSMKAPWELLHKRTEYYQILIKGMLRSLQVPLEKLRFIRGTDFQLKENYTKAVYQIIGITSVREAAKAGCEFVKHERDQLLSALVYPLLQALDEEFLGCDAQFGGVDQRKIFVYAESFLPRLSFAKRAHLMNSMIPGLAGGKMSATEENSKIDLLDCEETVKMKLQGANSNGKTAEDNGMFAFLKYVALPIKSHLNNNILNRYTTSEEIENDFDKGKLQEKDLKEMVRSILWSLMSSLRNEFVLANKESLINEAYPDIVLNTSIYEGEDTNSRQISDFPEEYEVLKSLFPELSNASSDKFPLVAEQPSIMWSVRVSGEPHIGYLIPLRKLAQLSTQNWKVIILIEDIGAYLHSKYNQNKPLWENLPERSQIYSDVCRSAFEVFGGNSLNLEIVLGSQFQLDRKYSIQMYQSLSKVTESECRQIVSKLLDNNQEITALSSVIYPCISLLDQLHFRATVRLFGDRQYASEVLAFDTSLSSKLGLLRRLPVYVYHKNLLSLNGKAIMGSPKMGAKTAPKDITSISMYDSCDIIKKKMMKAFFDPKSLTSDPTLDIIEKIIWPYLNCESFAVNRTAENGGDASFIIIGDIKEQLLVGILHPGDIKVAAADYLFNLMLGPIQQRLGKDCSSVLSSAFQEMSKKKIINKVFNPNLIDLRVAVVENVVCDNGSYKITVKIGFYRLTMTRKTLCHLNKNDYCLIVVKSVTDERNLSIIGLFVYENGSALILKKNPYADVVSFKDYDVVTTHLKESNAQLIIKEVAANCVVKGQYLEWLQENSQANEIRIQSKCDLHAKVTLSCD